MIEAPLAVAFAAGLIAIMNPCGFAMLPAYLSYFMGTGQGKTVGRPEALRRALLVGGVMSLSFLLIFGITGIAITAGFRAVIDWIPYIALGIGGLVALLGVAMLFGYELRVGLPKARTASKDGGLRSVFVFGLSYGAASLSCTLPVFLSVVAAQLTASSFISGATTFLVYALGMSMMLVAITIVLALGKQTLVGKLRNSARYINRASGVVLLAAGSYIVWFWATNLGQGADALNDSGAFRITETLSQRATEIFGENALLWATIFGGLIVAVVAYAFRADGGPRRPTSRRNALSAVAAAGALAAMAGTGVFAASSVGGSETRKVAAGT
ncbi:MAG: cytochrome c biogenesis CcdA family protein, partial [Gaiellaceae bacterium]